MIPCREEVVNVIRFLDDSLTAAGVKHHSHQDPDNPNLWSVATVHEDRFYMGFIAWNEEAQQVAYLAYDRAEERHRIAEGFPPDMAMTFLDMQNAYGMTLWLKGEVRQAQQSIRAKRIATDRAEIGLDSEA